MGEQIVLQQVAFCFFHDVPLDVWLSVEPEAVPKEEAAASCKGGRPAALLEVVLGMEYPGLERLGSAPGIVSEAEKNVVGEECVCVNE